jgi:hypothetical protein
LKAALQFAEKVCFWVAQRFQRCGNNFVFISGFSRRGDDSDFFSSLF